MSGGPSKALKAQEENLEKNPFSQAAQKRLEAAQQRSGLTLQQKAIDDAYKFPGKIALEGFSEAAKNARLSEERSTVLPPTEAIYPNSGDLGQVFEHTPKDALKPGGGKSRKLRNKKHRKTNKISKSKTKRNHSKKKSKQTKSKK